MCMAGPYRRVILYPHGMPHEFSSHTICKDLAVQCGGDPTRTVSATHDGMNDFVRRVNASKLLDDGQPALVMLTEADPIELNIVATNDFLCTNLPSLKSALWTIFLETTEERITFVRSARALGELKVFTGGPARWRTSEQTFLVLTPSCRDQPEILLRCATALSPQVQITDASEASPHLSGFMSAVPGGLYLP